MNYDLFKERLVELVRNSDLNDEEKDKKYTYLKASLYNIDLSNFTNDFAALEQEIENIESTERIRLNIFR